jgi:hypothetical protein
MAQTLQHRRKSTIQLGSEFGSAGEIFIDSSKNTVVVMDGSTAGGYPLLKESDVPTKVSDLTNDAGYITQSAVFSGDYNDLSNLPSLFSGAYADLSGKPTLFSGAYADLSGKPTLFSGVYADLTSKPTLFDGAYSSLTSVPTEFTPSSHTQAFSTITSTPTTLSGYGITDAMRNNATVITVGNVHDITSISDTVLGIGPNNFAIDFGTSQQNFANFTGADVVRIVPATELRVILGDSSEWVFGTGGGLDFPDFTTQTTAWTGTFSYNNLTDKPTVAVPATSIGQAGDTTGNVAFDSGYMYYCIAPYDGIVNVWKRVAWSVDTW